jgi:DNA-binding transcriptional ArsR family regulator
VLTVAGDYDVVAKALHDRTRRRVINALRMQPRCVAEIKRELDAQRLRVFPGGRPLPAVSRPAISQALKILRQAKMVKAQYEGMRHVYQLDDTGFDQLRDYLDDLKNLPGFRS